jgi:protein TonB
MRAKTLPLVGIGMMLVATVAVGYLVSRPALFVGQKSMPVFMGEGITVQRASKGITAIKAERAVKVERAMKAVSQPVTQPKIAAPLPILPPQVSCRILPEYPLSALEQGRQGTALLSVYVGVSGTPERIEIRSSSGVSELDRSALAAVSQWKFAPATQGGRAMASWFELPVRFEIK